MENYKKKTEDGFREFTKDLKQDALEGVLIFHGQERFLFKWAVDSLIKKFVTPGFEQLDYVKLDDVQDASAIIENAESSSMISSKRVIWIDNYRHLLDEKTKGYVGTDIDNLRNFLKNYAGNNILVFSYDDLGDKAKKLKEIGGKWYLFDKLEPSALNSFIKKRINGAGKTIDKQGLDLIVELSGYYNKESDYRLSNLQNDIMKVVALCDGEEIRTEDIEASMNGDLNTFVFDFIEALSNGQKEKAFSIMGNLLNSGTNFFQLIALIGNQFELMLEIMELDQEGMNSSQMVKALGMHEFRVKKAYKVSRKYTIKRLKETLVRLYEIDRNIKNGNIDQRTALELFVANA